MNAVMLYYARDVLGSASSFTWLYLAQTIGTIGIASQVPAITRKFGKRIGYVSLALVAAVGFVIIALVPAGGGGLLLALVAFGIYGVGFGGTNALMFSMQADTVDYGEWKTGTRAEGGSYSILSFVRKCGQGLGGFAGGAVIGAFGYAAGAQLQSDEAIGGIKVAAGWVPAGLCVIAALVLLLYPLGAEQHREIVAELRERRTRRALGAPTPDGRRRVADPRRRTDRRPTGRHRQRAVRRRRVVRGRAGRAATRSSLRRHPLQLRAAGTGRGRRVGARSARLLRRRSSCGRSPERRTRWTPRSRRTPRADTELVERNIADVIDRVKGAGGVIVGRDATVILSRMQGALHVRLQAPVRDTRRPGRRDSWASVPTSRRGGSGATTASAPRCPSGSCTGTRPMRAATTSFSTRATSPSTRRST